MVVAESERCDVFRCRLQIDNHLLRRRNAREQEYMCVGCDATDGRLSLPNTAVRSLYFIVVKKRFLTGIGSWRVSVRGTHRFQCGRALCDDDDVGSDRSFLWFAESSGAKAVVDDESVVIYEQDVPPGFT